MSADASCERDTLLRLLADAATLRQEASDPLVESFAVRFDAEARSVLLHIWPGEDTIALDEELRAD